ncbi:MAG: hypothetical protein GY857_10925 [Desulfobacula sp.]|nr:hypothetical protein [Desulfobacula sp.]
MKNTAVILFIILVNLIFTSNEVTATNSVLNPSIAELWVEIDGAIYGGPRPAGSSSLAMYNSNGELIKPNEKIAGRFLTAGYLYQDVKAKSYSALDETLDEVIFATSYAGLVNGGCQASCRLFLKRFGNIAAKPPHDLRRII